MGVLVMGRKGRGERGGFYITFLIHKRVRNWFHGPYFYDIELSGALGWTEPSGEPEGTGTEKGERRRGTEKGNREKGTQRNGKGETKEWRERGNIEGMERGGGRKRKKGNRRGIVIGSLHP